MQIILKRHGWERFYQVQHGLDHDIDYIQKMLKYDCDAQQYRAHIGCGFFS